METTTRSRKCEPRHRGDGNRGGSQSRCSWPKLKTYLSLSRLVQSESAAVVYDGQQFVGTIIKCDGQYDAFDPQGRCLGTFRNRTDAMRVFPYGGVS
jgi:hypothetical protein